MIKTSIKVEIKTPEEIYNRIITPAKKLRIAKMIETEVGPYVPRDTGDLQETTTVTGESITYDMPYAAVNYKGTDRNFSKEKNPLATAYWDKACMEAKSGAISRQADKIIRGFR